MITYWDAIALAIVVCLVLILALPKNIQYIINSVTLIAFGILPLLYLYDVITFDLFSYPVAKYVIFFVVIIAGRELFKEGIKEENLAMKIPSIALGLAIVIITAMPTLFNYGAISFKLPTYSLIIDCVIYLACGSLLFMGMSKVAEA